MHNEHFDAIVLGAGPAGLTAAIYLSRARIKTLVLNQGTVGGQMILTHEVANYPGVEHVSGYALANTMKKQAKEFGAVLKTVRTIDDIALSADKKTVSVNGDTAYTADVVILTPGGRSRTLGVPGENRFKGHGISYCATCDGEFFTGKEIVVVGGGNSALEEAVSLTKYATKVTIVHQFDHFQGFQHAIDEALNHPKIDVMTETVVNEFYGDERLEGVMLRNLKTNEVKPFATDGVFVFIGYQANTEGLNGIVELNKWNEIVVDANMQTSVEGVFAAGDAIAKRFRQITTAVGDATTAALAASAWLHERKREGKPAFANS